MHPLIPVMSIKQPMCVHESYQKDVNSPLCTSDLTKDFAIALYLSNFLHIQEPREEELVAVQKEFLRMGYRLIQLTHSDE